MKKIKLLVLPLLAFSLASCGESDIPEGGNIGDLIPTEFDFNNFSRNAVYEVLDQLQHNSGYMITFKVSHFDDINKEATFVSNVTIAGKDGYSWATETTNNETYGAACNIVGDNFTGYVFKDGAWQFVDEVTYTREECVNFINENVDQVVIKDEYLNKIDFTHASGSTTICSRSCYSFTYSGDYYLSIAIDKVLGIYMSCSVVYVDATSGICTRDIVEVQSISMNNIEIPAFPAN